MNLTIRQLAEAFSCGQFESVYPYLAENIQWNIFGEKLLQGRRPVMEQCEKVATYFQSVVTDFKTYHIIKDKNNIAINGKGEFMRNGEIVGIIDTCDVYEFSDLGEIRKIYSYCINGRKS